MPSEFEAGCIFKYCSFFPEKQDLGFHAKLHEMSEYFSLDINDQYQSAFVEYIKEKEILIIKILQVITKKS